MSTTFQLGTLAAAIGLVATWFLPARGEPAVELGQETMR
jgi:hypothetical protein